MENHNLCEAVRDIPPGAARRCWTLRADNHGHHHGRVRLSECPLYLELQWRPTAEDTVQRVGVFRLDLTGLLRGGFIRPDPADSHGPDARLRIVRADDGNFYVQTNERGPRLLLARGASAVPASATAPPTPSAGEPPVTRIYVEYADGSSDDMRLLQRGRCPLFDLQRKRPDTEMRSLGAHTAGAIAAILFRTAVTTERTEYPIHDPKLIAVLRQWFEQTPSQKERDGSQSG